MGVGRGGGRHNVRKRSARRHIRVENQFLDSHDLFSVAIFL